MNSSELSNANRRKIISRIRNLYLKKKEEKKMKFLIV